MDDPKYGGYHCVVFLCGSLWASPAISVEQIV